MGVQNLTDFERLLVNAENRAAPPILMILAWISASDGEIAASEAQQIVGASRSLNYSGDGKLILNLAKAQDLSAIQLSLEVLSRQLNEKGKVLFLQLAIGTAMGVTVKSGV